jgi:phosphoglycerate dehydrogenase-like enzyme
MSERVTVLTHVGGDIPERIRAAIPDVEVVEIAGDELADGLTGEVLYTTAWPPPNLERVLARGVRWVHTMGTGMDRFPLELISDQVVTCTKGGSGIPISEWVLAVMLAFAKRLPDAWIHDAEAQWHWADLGGLHGHTLGLVGLGGIGTEVADRALPFGMDVVAYRRSDAPAHRPEVEVTRSLADLLGRADHVVITAPSTPETRHLIDADAFAAMKPGTHLVNIARGALVDQDALRVALDDGQVAMASLDTVEPEPLPVGHWMYTHPKVRLSPHISWSMPDASAILVATFVDNLRRYQNGEPLEGVVDVDAGY